MNGDANPNMPNRAGAAPVHGGQTDGAETSGVGGREVSAPAPSKLTPHEKSTLAQRHHFALQILPTLSQNERWELLAAVVWPESDLLRTFQTDEAA